MTKKKYNKSYEDLQVWEMAIVLADDIYKITRTFPKEELYGLTDQIRRSSVSVASNIAEGAARNSRKEFFHFLGITLGSLAELKTQLIIATRAGMLTSSQLATLRETIDRIGRMTSGLRSSLTSNQQPATSN